MKKFLFVAIFAFVGFLAFAQEKIAVFPFEDPENFLTKNEPQTFYRLFANAFANATKGKFYVVPRQDVEKLVGTEADFQSSKFSEKLKTAEGKKVLAGTQILSGLISQFGNDIVVTVSLYSYPELQQLSGVDITVTSKDELRKKIPELVQKMVAEMSGSVIPEGLIWTIVDKKIVRITEYNGNAKVLYIPDRIQDLPVTVIGAEALKNNNSLTNIIIPSSVMTIEDYVFRNCQNLAHITIPSSVTSIGYGAFNGCPSLKNIEVDNRNPAYKSINGALFDKNARTIILYPSGNFGSYSIPAGVTTIGEFAFLRSNLSSITIPSSVTEIVSDFPFGTCYSLTSITVESNNSVFASIDGVLFDKQIKKLIRYPQGKKGAYTMPSTVTELFYYAFSYSKYLTSVTFSSSLTDTGWCGFAGCTGLTSIILPSSLKYISAESFSGCTGLTSITIPSSVMEIYHFAFHGCSNLISVTLSRRTQVKYDETFPSSTRITYSD